MARARKPLSQQKGDLTAVRQAERKTEEQAVITGKEILDLPPEWLCDAVATEEFKRVVRELSQIDIIGNLDYANIGAYANAYAGYVKATKRLKRQPLIVKKPTKTGVIECKNPLITVQEDYAREMRTFGNLCGISIDSRLKAAATKTAKAKDEIKDEFGDI